MSIEERYVYELGRNKQRFHVVLKQVKEIHGRKPSTELLKELANQQLQIEALKKALIFAQRLVENLESKIPDEGGESE